MKCPPNQNGLWIEVLDAGALVGECNHGVENLIVLGHGALVEVVLYDVDGRLRHLRVDIDTSMAFIPTFILSAYVPKYKEGTPRDRRQIRCSKLPVLNYPKHVFITW